MIKWNLNDNTSEYIIFGAGQNFEMLLYILKANNININIKYIVDNDASKWKTKTDNISIYSPDMLSKEDKSAKIIVTSDYYFNEISKQLSDMLFIEYDNFVCAKDVLPQLIFTNNSKVNLFNTAFYITSKCTLKCKYCVQMSPYIKNKTNFTIESIKKDFENYFNIVDFVYKVTLVGGEPLLYDKLTELIKWLTENYGKRFLEVNIITNGTIIPNDELLNICKINNIIFDISVYEDIVSNSKREMLIKKLLDNNIKFSLVYHKSWTKLWRNDEPEKISSVNKIKFKACNNKCRSVFNSKYFFCAQPVAELLLDKDNFVDDYFDLSCDKNDIYINKLNFVNYEALNIKKGYISTCEKCNGFNNKNYSIPIAEQL